MQRPFSRPFRFMLLAAFVLSAFLSYALLWLFKGQLNDAVTLCTSRNATCSFFDVTDRALHVFLVSETAGALLVFWLACKIGRSFIKPPPPTAEDSAR